MSRLFEVTGLLTLLLTGSFLSLEAHASDQNSSVLRPQSHALSASPDAATFGYSWRNYTRGVVGGHIPFVGRHYLPGFSLSLVPLIELHNDVRHQQPLPNDNWRARIGLEALWGWGDDPTQQHGWVGGILRHESDHITSRVKSEAKLLTLNDVAARVVFHSPFPGMMLRIEVEARWFFFACTKIEESCSDFNGPQSFGGNLDLIFDKGGAEPSRDRWYFFGALHASGVIPHEKVVSERRGVVHLGAWKRGKAGLWQVFAIALVGSDVGIRRGGTEYQGGVGFRWGY